MRTELNRLVKVAIVNGICVKADAISQIVDGTAQALTDRLNAECRVFTYACDFRSFETRIVNAPIEIVLDPFFQSADIVLFHFGIHYDLFNAVFLAPSNAKIIVRYHNITPKAFVRPSEHKLIEKSLEQRANVAVAHEVWADSEYNKQDLIRFGIEAEKIRVSPLYVKFSDAATAPRRDKHHPVELLFVGRFVKSKGVLDLIQAISNISADCPPLRLRLIGNVDFSDPDYVRLLQERIKELGLHGVVVFEGKVDDETLRQRYLDADVFVSASYHEGFCVPLVEAMHFGCVPVAYEAGNVGALLGNVGIRVPTGDITRLTAAISNVVASVGLRNSFGDEAPISWGSRWDSWAQYRAELAEYADQFSFHAFSDRVADRVSALLISGAV